MAEKLITWTKEYSIGYSKIDNQHKKLVKMINELYDSFVEGNAENMTENILKKMINYTDYHFKTEEEAFEKYNYSDTKSHIKEHKDFVEKATNFYQDFKNGNVYVTYDIMNFLREWLVNHIAVSDKKYGIEFQKQNITEL